MIKLNREDYRNKVYACWIGKNIGGTMGGPFENKREYLDVKGYVTPAGEPLPNDDLDLQLVWLHAMEKLGPKAINCQTLGDFWVRFIPPHWNEYGIGKVNMRMGIPAPACGDYKNLWKHSNGAWIRTEVWACMAPAAPEVAARYAIEDAKVDHGVGEGTYAAAFVAAMQSAAFVEKDIRKLIAIGLANIPAESRMADSIRALVDCYDQHMSEREARDFILERNADIGDGWFQAPSNVAYAVLGLLWGEGDFKRSMLAAINCGDDTDCTAATVGATLGIMYGKEGIPADWQAHIGDTIITISVATGVLTTVPKTCTELTERVVRQAPHVLFANAADVELSDGESDWAADVSETFAKSTAVADYLRSLRPYAAEYTFGPVRATISTLEEPEIRPGGEVHVQVRFENLCRIYGNCPTNLRLRWLLPEGFTVEGETRFVRMAYKNMLGDVRDPEIDVVIRAGERVDVTNRVVLEFEIQDHATVGYVPLVLLG